MSMNVGGSGSSIKADINVTPLVDVMLVLLIIMMIIAPLLQQGVSLTLPVAVNSSEKPETQEDTLVQITADGRFHLNGLAVAEGDLRRRVEEALELKNQRIIIVKADEDAAYSAVMAAMDELRAAGLEDIGLITERRTNGGGE
ncbi:MAG: exbD 3 [Acidobacteria bacterium]|nr:exbD 3 [Acidobacteriota bacterium]